MNASIHTSRRSAAGALALIMTAAFVAWALFVAGKYVEILDMVGDVWSGTTQQVSASPYFMLGAMAVLGIGALIARRMVSNLRARDVQQTVLAKPVQGLATIVMLVAAVLAALSVATLALGGLFNYGEPPAPLVRLLNVYLPIVLYTALILVLILVGFVFSPAAAKLAASQLRGATGDAAGRAQGPSGVITPRIITAESLQGGGAQRAAAPEEADQQQQQVADQQRVAAAKSRQSAAAMAFAIPIIATAVALLLGLIVFDLTTSAPQVWIWVIIVTIVGAGVFVGTMLARQGERASGRSSGVAVGARWLNFCLSIAFAAFASGLAMGYGSAAVSSLDIAPSVYVYAYDERADHFGYEGEAVELDNPVFSVSGYDLRSGGEITLTLDPGGETLEPVRVGGDGWGGEERELPEGLAAGDYELVIQGVARDDTTVSASLPLTVLDSGAVEFAQGTEASFDTMESRQIPLSAGWVFGDLVPAALLMLVPIAVVAGTLVVRNRDRE